MQAATKSLYQALLHTLNYVHSTIGHGILILFTYNITLLALSDFDCEFILAHDQILLDNLFFLVTHMLDENPKGKEPCLNHLQRMNIVQ